MPGGWNGYGTKLDGHRLSVEIVDMLLCYKYGVGIRNDRSRLGLRVSEYLADHYSIESVW